MHKEIIKYMIFVYGGELFLLDELIRYLQQWVSNCFPLDVGASAGSISLV